MHDQATARPIRELAVDLRAHGHLRREGFSMALYVAIVLLSALSVLSDRDLATGTVFLLILGTTVGLVVAHGFAAWVASRVVGHEGDGPSPWDVLRVQLGAAALVATVAIVAVALAATANELAVARATVAATIAGLVFAESRRNHPLGRATAHGLVALVAALVVAWLKTALGH